jgi:hypothetical protein
MQSPRGLVADLESSAAVPEGREGRFFGYSVIGLTFLSGHILALRRFPASSIGRAYTSVWHRNPFGKWTFFQDAPPHASCSRYFGKGIDETIEQPVHVEWTGSHRFVVQTAGLDWQVDLRTTITTSIMNASAALLPERLWRNPPGLAFVGRVAPALLGTRSLRLSGQLPNGQTYIANPKKIWMIAGSRATISGRNAGEPGPLQLQPAIGGFLIPQRGVFALASARFESFDPARHQSVPSKPLFHDH